jgi:hypothetical protein
MGGDNKMDERLNWEDALWEGAILVASSRSGITEDIRLSDGTLVEVKHFKSGKIACQAVSTIAPHLTVISEDDISSDYLRMHGHPKYWVRAIYQGENYYYAGLLERRQNES